MQEKVIAIHIYDCMIKLSLKILIVISHDQHDNNENIICSNIIII